MRKKVENAGQNWDPLDENNDSTLRFESQQISVTEAIIRSHQNRKYFRNVACSSGRAKTGLDPR
jgi:hypothetical protein